MSWLGFHTTTFHSADHVVTIPLRRKPLEEESSEERHQSLLELTKEILPPCRLNPFLPGGHLQTFWTAVKSSDVPILYRRRIFDSDCKTYPGTFAVDFVVSEQCESHDQTLPPRTTYYDDASFDSLGSDDEKPMLIVLHGLAGGSNEVYLRSVLKPLCLDPPENKKWEACVVNSRGCAMSKITSGVLYNARATWDVGQVVKWARQRWPSRKLFGCGFSLGANILVNYLGEEGVETPLDAAIVISNPWNLDISNAMLKASWIGLNVYMRVMGASMRELWRTHREDILRDIKDIDAKKVDNVKFLYEFDRYVQCPTWGWPTEGAYYRDASSVEPLIKIQVPLFALHAKDDPIVHDSAAPYQEIKQCKYAVMAATSGGGHLSWFQFGGGRWFATAAAAWLNKMSDEADFDALREARMKTASENGSTGVGYSKTLWNALQRKLYDHAV